MKKVGIGCGVVFVGIFVILVIAAIVRGGPRQEVVSTPGARQPTPPPAAVEKKPRATPLPGIGFTARKGNWEVTLEGGERQSSLPARFGEAKKPQGQFVIIRAILKNVGKETYSLSAWDFNIFAPGDVKYKLVGELGVHELEGYETVWLSVRVQPGLSQKVRLIFDVPPDLENLILDVQGIRFSIPD